VDNHQFKFSSNKITEPGFTKIATWLALKENNSDISKFITNDKVQISSIEYQ
jgi:DNA topoisomerase IA